MANLTGARPLPDEKEPPLPYKPSDGADPSVAEAAGMYGDIATAEEYGYVHRGLVEEIAPLEPLSAVDSE